VAVFHCESCGLSRNVPDKYLGRTIPCPKCGEEVSIGGEAETKEALPEEEYDRGLLVCSNCGFMKSVPGRLVGKTGKCPQCQEAVTVLPDSNEEVPTDSVPEKPSPSAGPRFDDIATSEPDDEGEAARVSLFQGNIITNVLGGVVTGLLSVFFSLAFVGLIFSEMGTGTEFPHALSLALVSATVVTIVFTLLSRIPFAIAAPESVGAAMLFLLVSSMYTQLREGPPEAVFPTIAAAVSIAAVVTGLCLYGVGRLKAGDWIRYLPPQVVGGLLAGVGFLLLKGAFVLLMGPDASLSDLWISANVGELYNMLDQDSGLQWVPALIFGLVLFAVPPRLRSSLAALIIILLGVAAAQGLIWWQGKTMPEAAAAGWLFSAIEPYRPWEAFNADMLLNVQWSAIADHAGYIVAMAGLVIAALMLKVIHMEITAGQEYDLDRECANLGTANILSGLAGGMTGSLSMGRSLGNHALGARGPVAGILAGAICAAALYFMDYFVPHIPKFVPAGILIYFGASLLRRWLAETRSELTRSQDYHQLLVIFLVTAVLGLVLGAAVAVAAALLILVSRYTKVSVVKHMLSGANHHSNVDRAPSQVSLLKTKGGHIYVLRLQGFIFLGTTHSLMSNIRTRLKAKDQPPARFIILDFTLVSGLDSSVAITFAKLKQLARENRITLIFCNVLWEVEEELQKSGYKLDDPEGGSRTFMNLDFAMEWCEDRVLEAEDALTVKQQTLPELLSQVFPEPKLIPRLMKYLRKVHVKEGEHVFRQGDISDAMYFVESGMVSVELELEANKILRLKKMGPGTVFGEMGIYTTAPRSASIVAAESCVVYRLATKDLEAIQAKDPLLVSAIHRFIVNLLAGRVFEANAKVRDLQQ
jgi:sulfate permease, SulP family